jgi:hypothetical protein
MLHYEMLLICNEHGDTTEKQWDAFAGTECCHMLLDIPLLVS